MSSKNGKSGKDKGGKPYAFDIDNPELPEEIAEHALTSGGYPYDEELKKKVYSEQLVELQLELLKLQTHIEGKAIRFLALFEGRDASGKGSCISRFLERLNPRHARSVEPTARPAVPPPLGPETTPQRRLISAGRAVFATRR